MLSREERIAARLAAKLKQAGGLWEGASWKDIVEYGSVENPNDLPPGMTRARWLKVQEHLQWQFEQNRRNHPELYDDEPAEK